MAARRLIIVMVILLGISTAIAIVVPEPKTDDPQEETTGVTGPTGATGPTGSDGDGSTPPDSELVEANVTAGENVQVVRANPGDRVVLTIQPKAPDDVVIEALGLTATAAELSPAVFDFIMPRKPETFSAIQLADGKVLATITASPNESKKTKADEAEEATPAEPQPEAQSEQLIS